MKLAAIILCVVSFSNLARANTEKTIFLGPASVHIPDVRPGFRDLNLESLSPTTLTVRKHLKAAFPTSNVEKGEQSWYLLDKLEPGRRYEVRVCWAANQPTQFWLYTHSIEEVFETTALISALAQYSESRIASKEPAQVDPKQPGERESAGTSERSLLFLQVFAAADFYTTNQSLMNNPPPVYVDLILDPYFLNILPKSLIPTVIFIVLVSIGSWYLSGRAWKWLLDLISTHESKPHSD